MSLSAIIMMVLGIVIIWGGLLLSVGYAVKVARQQR
ncbi:methionine/alanine import family NSS transporter small subunit [Halolactibacillus alkaliphilus]|nr:methionine/alanine import family NSS transporter small subunit [Halolactibacillus alkaliphilus]